MCDDTFGQPLIAGTMERLVVQPQFEPRVAARGPGLHQIPGIEREEEIEVVGGED
jgi:hypothetical protein